MAQLLTYRAEIQPPPGVSLVPQGLIVSATITNLNTPIQSESISFSLLNTITGTNPPSRATVEAVFTSPAFPILSTIPNLAITIQTWNTAVQPGNYIAPATNLITVNAVGATNTSSSTSNTSSATATRTVASTTSPTDISPTESPSEPSSKASQSTSGYSSGILAGVAIGCLLGGILIAALIAMFIFRRRSRKRVTPEKPTHSRSPDEYHGESVLVDASKSKAWQKQLPQPESDNTMRNLTSRTLDEIEIFVEEFYSNMLSSGSELIATSDLSTLNSPYLQRAVFDLLLNAHDPTVLIKHCIAYFLIQKIDLSGDSSASLLPKEYIISRSSTIESQNDSKYINQARSQLRVLTAYFQPGLDQNESYLAQRSQTIADAVRTIESAFQPFARGNVSARQRALTGVMIHISELGTKLFAQPACFEWIWEQNQSPSHVQRTNDEIVMLPGLNKTTDQNAQALAPALSIVRPRLATWSKQAMGSQSRGQVANTGFGPIGSA